MKRYFYNCAVKAAYMEKYHGMRWEDDRPGQDIDDGYLIHVTKRKDEKIFIRSDKLKLLEPQVGDLLIGYAKAIVKVGWINSYAGDWDKVFSKKPRAKYQEYNKCFAVDEYDDWEDFTDEDIIIQRNGIPFIWPESKKSKEALPTCSGKSKV